MVRSLCIIALAFFGLIPLHTLAQEHPEPELFISLFNNLYSFHFQDAENDLAQLHSIPVSPDLLDIGIANYHWWLIVTQKENDQNKTEMISSLDRIIKRYEGIPPGHLDQDQIFAITHAYAYKTRLDMHEKHYLKGAGNLNLTIKYLEIIVPQAEENPKFMLLAGMYHYAAGAIKESYPLFSPFLAFGPKTDKEEGLQLLRKCAENEHPMIRTEARYFIMKVQNQLERNHKRADQIAQQLLKEYPDNKYFRFCRVTILADAGHLKESKLEYNRLCSIKPGEQLTTAQHSFLIKETDKNLRKKRIKF